MARHLTRRAGMSLLSLWLPGGVGVPGPGGRGKRRARQRARSGANQRRRLDLIRLNSATQLGSVRLGQHAESFGEVA